MRIFKVLSVDGGGIKGLYSATVLHHMEKALQSEHGPDARIADHVDLVCGTSTGGLIALAIGLRVGMERVCDFYESWGPQIFRNSRGICATLRQVFFGKYSDKKLREALQAMYGDKSLGDSDCLLCIPTYDVTLGGYEVFKFDHREGGLHRHNRVKMVDVGLATSAAPTYFPLAQVDSLSGAQFVDGGVWANNPSLVGLTEAMWHFVGPEKAFDAVEMLSIASLNAATGKPALLKRRRGFVQWVPDLFELGLNAQSEFADVFLTFMRDRGFFPLSYKRVPSATISAEQRHHISLDSATEQSIMLMKQMGTEAYHVHRSAPEVVRFFETRKTYQTRSEPAKQDPAPHAPM